VILNPIPKPSTLPPATRLGAGPDRLDSWKEIASYLKREVRTVQLWEKKEGLPVHRHYHNQLGTVFAFRSEIEQWGMRQASRRTPASDTPLPANHDPQPIRLAIRTPEATSSEETATLCASIAAETITLLERLEHSSLSIQRTASNADYLLQLETYAAPEGLDITAALTCTQTHAAMWSRSFHLLPTSDSTVLSAIAEQIAQCLWLKIISLAPDAAQAGKAAAREAYLKGRYLCGQRNEDGLRKAAAWFRTAIQEDPSFALPYSGLADSLTLLCFYEMEQAAVAMPEAYRAARRATELDPHLAEAHASLADVHLHFDRDWDAAEREYRRAIQCNPRYMLAYHWYANLLAAKGQHEAAHIAITRALEIDPASLITQVWAGVTAYLAHRFDAAITHYQSALEMDPNFVWAHMYRAQALVQQGDFAEALRAYDTTLRLTGGNRSVAAMKAHACAASGDRAAARRILRDLLTVTGAHAPSYDIAAVYVALNDSTRALQWLRRACKERSMKLFMLVQDPRFTALHRRPEFQALIQSIGLHHAHAFGPHAVRADLAMYETPA